MFIYWRVPIQSPSMIVVLDGPRTPGSRPGTPKRGLVFQAGLRRRGRRDGAVDGVKGAHSLKIELGK
jgi:hypothetical protein